MKNNKHGVLKTAANLAITCFICGAVIAATYFITAPVAAAKSVELKNNAMKALVKEAEDLQPVEGKEGWYLVQKGGKTIGYIVPSETKGFGGTIKLLVAVTPDGRVIDYDILSHNETPGLGDNASKDSFRRQFKDKKEGNLKVVKDPSDTKHIDAMTGATISSRAVTEGVKKALEQVVKYTGGK